MDTIGRLRDENEELRSQLNEKTHELAKIKGEMEALAQMNDHRNNSVVVLRKELSSILDDHAVLKEEMKQLKTRVIVPQL